MMLIRVSAMRVSERVTLVEVSDDFLTTLDTVSESDTQGRMLVHEKFGELENSCHHIMSILIDGFIALKLNLNCFIWF